MQKTKSHGTLLFEIGYLALTGPSHARRQLSFIESKSDKTDPVVTEILSKLKNSTCVCCEAKRISEAWLSGAYVIQPMAKCLYCTSNKKIPLDKLNDSERSVIYDPSKWASAA